MPVTTGLPVGSRFGVLGSIVARSVCRGLSPTIQAGQTSPSDSFPGRFPGQLRQHKMISPAFFDSFAPRWDDWMEAVRNWPVRQAGKPDLLVGHSGVDG